VDASPPHLVGPGDSPSASADSPDSRGGSPGGGGAPRASNGGGGGRAASRALPQAPACLSGQMHGSALEHDLRRISGLGRPDCGCADGSKPGLFADSSYGEQHRAMNVSRGGSGGGGGDGGESQDPRAPPGVNKRARRLVAAAAAATGSLRGRKRQLRQRAAVVVGAHLPASRRVALAQRFHVPTTAIARHTDARDSVFCVSYSPDGRSLLSAAQDRVLRLYRAGGGCGRDGTGAMAWDEDAHRAPREIVARDVGWSVIDAAYTPDSAAVAYSSWSPAVHLVTFGGDHATDGDDDDGVSMPPAATHTALDMNASGARIAFFSLDINQGGLLAGCSDGRVYLYDLNGGALVGRGGIEGGEDVNAVTFLDDGGVTFATGGDDGLLHIWDRRMLGLGSSSSSSSGNGGGGGGGDGGGNGRLPANRSFDDADDDNDDQTCAGDDGDDYASSRQSVFGGDGGFSGGVVGGAPRSAYFGGGSVTREDLGLGDPWARGRGRGRGSVGVGAGAGAGAPVMTLAGHSAGLTGLDARGDGYTIASNSKDQSLKLWDVRRGGSPYGIRPSTALWDYRWQRPGGRPRPRHDKIDDSLMTMHGHRVARTLIRCRFSPMATTGGRFIASGSFCGAVHVYDCITGRLATKLAGHTDAVRDVAWSPVLPRLASSSWDSSVVEWGYRSADALVDACTSSMGAGAGSGSSLGVYSSPMLSDDDDVASHSGGEDDGTANSLFGRLLRDHGAAESSYGNDDDNHSYSDDDSGSAEHAPP
jgi:WD40 repeat protein